MSAADAERALNDYFEKRGGHGHDAVRTAARHPIDAIRALRFIARLSVIDAELRTDGDAALVRRGLERTNPLARRLIRGTTAVLVVPDTVEEFLAGSSESKRSLRTRFNRATRRGYHVHRTDGHEERRAVLALADRYERSHPDELYRNQAPDNDYLLGVGTWLVAHDVDCRPLILAVPAISGEWAVLQHFKTLESSDDARLARYWMSVELVRELHAQGVRYLADVLSPIGLPNGLRDFQRRLGYRLHRVRIRP
ncbi:hypothetical protein [Amnibacterium soli]